MTTALERYQENTADEPITDPIEALRFFCSLSMNGKDWMDVERLFDAASKERNELHTKNERLRDALLEMCEMWASVCGGQGWDSEHMSQYVKACAAMEETK